jgi:hypothetical protein
MTLEMFAAPFIVLAAQSVIAEFIQVQDRGLTAIVEWQQEVF